jgi:hypothetical protein
MSVRSNKDYFIEDMQSLSLIETHPSYAIIFYALPLVPDYKEGDEATFVATLRNATTQYGDEAVIGVLKPFTDEIDLRQNLPLQERLKNPSVMAILLHGMFVQNPERFLQAVEQYTLVRQNTLSSVR